MQYCDNTVCCFGSVWLQLTETTTTLFKLVLSTYKSNHHQLITTSHPLIFSYGKNTKVIISYSEGRTCLKCVRLSGSLKLMMSPICVNFAM